MTTNQMLRGGEVHLPNHNGDGRPSPAAKFQVTFILDEFPITAEFTGNAAQLRTMTERLRALGAVPPVPPSVTPQTASAVAAPAQQQETIPVCCYHGAMKKAPWGKYRRTARLPDGSFCKERAA